LNGDCMETIEPVLIVADAGPLIHLDELSALDVLRDYSSVLVPDAVWKEVHHHRPQALKQTNVKLLRQTAPPSSAKIKAITSLYTLHHGEREALTLCLSHSINTLITDDTAARLAAKTLNIKAHGTLGLLIRINLPLIWGQKAQNQVCNGAFPRTGLPGNGCHGIGGDHHVNAI